MERILHYDTVIVGGGTAGVAAAVGAARSGARTLLIERDAYLGGEATHSGISAFCGFYSCGDDPVKVVSGVGDLVLAEMERLGPTTEIVVSATGNKNINFQPEYLKCALDALLEQEGVSCLLHARVVAAQVNAAVLTSLQCVDDEGCFTVTANTFVDATGDANLAHMAGAGTIWGGESGQVQAATLPFRLSHVDTTQDLTPAAVERAILQAKQAGYPNLTKEKGFILKQAGYDTVTVLLPSVIPTGISAQELTLLEQDTRRQVLSYVKALRAFLPGMEHCELAVIGPTIGFRETRRLLGRETLSAEAVLERRKRRDGVARGGWKPEIHKSLQQMGTYLEVSNGSYFDIPLNALRSATLNNLYGAGRIVSSDDVAFAAVRVMGTCFATGHAAGVAAAFQALGKGQDVQDIRQELERQGALI